MNDKKIPGDFDRTVFLTAAALTFVGATALGYGAFWIVSNFLDGRISALIGIAISAITCLIVMYCLDTDLA